jgi:hypothetical protein
MHRLSVACWLACSIALLGVASGCSAVINPDPSQLHDDAGATRDGAIPGIDTGIPNDAYVAPGTDTGMILPGDDAWVAQGDDAGIVVGNDAWVAPPPDAWVTPDAWIAPACTGVECTGWAAALATASRGSAGSSPSQALANCVIQMHVSDCCGARDALGINHSARGSTLMPGLCAAEASCDAMYPMPRPCSSDVITTDTGETTTNPNNVRLRVVDARSCSFGTCYTCQTFVCMSDTCRSAPGIAGGCGP